MKRTLLLTISIFFTLLSSAQDFTISRGERINVCMTGAEKPVAETALQMFADDIKAVLGGEIVRTKKAKNAKLHINIMEGMPREGFTIDVKDSQLYISAADSHGMAYGILEVSRLLGVSPWEWWADCSARPKESFTLKEGYHDEQSPAVAYRGIFINDEDWGLNPWAKMHEGIDVKASKYLKNNTKSRIVAAIGPQSNERIFQLLLRLRANYYWPAMHECTMPFFLTEGNREIAAKYGIYMGGSHCEPMACSAAAEWGLRGVGDYNYVTNRESVKRFWGERVNDVKNQEIVYTIGMRGVHDGAMEGVKTPADKLKYLQMVIDDQRRMLDSIVVKGNKAYNSVDEVPQVFVPYKEVLETYRAGLQVPDDVTLMWTDDNYGYIRQFPNEQERMRKGGSGLYYHVSYWGRPHDYTWLSAFSPALLQYQMREAYNRGIQRIWMLNVGDIKPAEFLIERFMDMAWNGQKDSAIGCKKGCASECENEARVGCADCNPFDYAAPLYSFLAREFGSKVADRVLPLMQEYYRLATDRMPEHVGGQRVEEKDKAYWNLPREIKEWNKTDVEQRIASYKAISDAVETIWPSVPEDRKDAFFQLVKYPIQAAAQMNFKFLCDESHDNGGQMQLDSIAKLTQLYNKGFANGGKWDGIMSCKPRNLAAFGTTGDFKGSYPDDTHGMPLLSKDYTEVAKNECFTIGNIEVLGDSIEVEVRLMPNHPVDGKELAFTISVDGGEQKTVSYKTFDREEAWKQNVLRNYAVRILRLPISNKLRHSITIGAATEGVVVRQVFLKNIKKHSIKAY